MLNGNLRSDPLPFVLTQLGASRKSGILTLWRGELKKQVCLVQGLIRSAASNLSSERLGEFLLREGLADAGVLERAESTLAPGTRLGAVLLRMEAIGTEELRSAVRRHIVDILLPCFDWTEGSFKFIDGVPDIAGEIRVEMAVLELLLERARRRENRALLSRLGSNRDALLRRTAGAEQEIAAVSLTPLETFILSRAQGTVSIEEILSQSGEQQEATLRALHALIEAGLVDVVFQEMAAAAAVRGERAPAAFKSELISASEEGRARHYLELCAKSEGADHYQLLGVPRGANEEEVRRAYYQLARELHPDRFTSPALSGIRGNMEAHFARITEAYNTLGQAASREKYDLKDQPETSDTAPPVSEAARNKELGRRNFLRGRSLVEQGKLSDALKFLQNAVGLDSSRPEYLLLLGTLQARHPRLKNEALASLIRAARLDPTNPLAHIELGRLQRRLGNNEESEKCFRGALRCDPDNVAAREQLGVGKAGRLRGLFGRGNQQ